LVAARSGAHVGAGSGVPEDRRRAGLDFALRWAAMNPTWIWLQIAIIVVVLIGMVVAIVKLA
jgi:hypothetical protein